MDDTHPTDETETFDLEAEETALLTLYRAAQPALRKAALAALASGFLPGPKIVTIGRDNTGVITM